MLGELQLIEKKINGCNPAVSGNDEISPSVSWRVPRAARYRLDPPGIAYFLGLGYWLISKVRVSSLDRARDSIDLVAASVDASLGIVEHAIFGEDLVNRRTPTRRVVLTEDVVKIAGQQGRYAVESWLLFLLFGPCAACANVSGGLNLTLLADVHRRLLLSKFHNESYEFRRPVRFTIAVSITGVGSSLRSPIVAIENDKRGQIAQDRLCSLALTCV